MKALAAKTNELIPRAIVAVRLIIYTAYSEYSSSKKEVFLKTFF